MCLDCIGNARGAGTAADGDGDGKYMHAGIRADGDDLDFAIAKGPHCAKLSDNGGLDREGGSRKATVRCIQGDEMAAAR